MTLDMRGHLVHQVGIIWGLRRSCTVAILVLLRSLNKLAVSIDKSYSLDVIASMMIVLVAPHYKVLLGFLQAQISHWLSSITRDIDIC